MRFFVTVKWFDSSCRCVCVVCGIVNIKRCDLFVIAYMGNLPNYCRAFLTQFMVDIQCMRIGGVYTH